MTNLSTEPSGRAASVVLASRSPRRKALLEGFLGDGHLTIVPPASPHEAGFSDATTTNQISLRLMEIVEAKLLDVQEQLKDSRGQPASTDAAPWIVAADTIVVVTDDSGIPRVLGQPGEPDWKTETRNWFRRWLSGRVHTVRTGVIVTRGQERRSWIETTDVEFDDLDETALERYLATEESIGKAGGYAIQGYAAAFVRSVSGSLTSVVGLPVLEVVRALNELGWRHS